MAAPRTASNGEVEGPPENAQLEPRVHTVFRRTRHVTIGRSRSSPTIVRGRGKTHFHSEVIQKASATATKAKTTNTHLGGNLSVSSVTAPSLIRISLAFKRSAASRIWMQMVESLYGTSAMRPPVL